MMTQNIYYFLQSLILEN